MPIININKIVPPRFLERSFSLSRAVGLIPLPGQDDIIAGGTICSVSGWGRIADGSTPNTLRAVDVKIISDTGQQKGIAKRHGRNLLTKSHITPTTCQGNLFVRETCQGNLFTKRTVH